MSPPFFTLQAMIKTAGKRAKNMTRQKKHETPYTLDVLDASIQSFVDEGHCILMDMKLKRSPGIVDVFAWSAKEQSCEEHATCDVLRLQVHFQALLLAFPKLQLAAEGQNIRYVLRSFSPSMDATPILAVRTNERTVVDAELQSPSKPEDSPVLGFNFRRAS